MLPNTTPDALAEAMADFDAQMRDSDSWRHWESRESYKYAIEHNGRLYPVKQIISMATGVDVSSFSGGDQANRFVTELGFPIVALHADRLDRATQWWIEKTLVRGRPSREEGDYALGKVLWSPQRSKNGADIYRFMREVQPGDVILHLTDNEAFTAISKVASPVNEFAGVRDTEWGETRSYIVSLEDFITLDPPLGRDTFLAGEYKNALIQITKLHKNLFYNGRGNFNQGAYLTPAPPPLVKILDEAYFELTGRTLTELAGVRLPSVSGIDSDADPVEEMARLAEVTHLSTRELREIDELLREKKHVIFEGPPGTGKTYIAEKFARYFTGNPLDGDLQNDQLKMVQFHQSYGYEDFIQGIRPETIEEEGGSSHLEYHLRAGVFKDLCERAQDSDDNFVIIIDEINRGNISRIFGELLFLLEYRHRAVSLAYSRPDDPMFTIPSNVYVIGTMNTTDRSLAQIDYALRRRFYFYHLVPVVAGRAQVLQSWLAGQGIDEDQGNKLLRLFITLNEKIQRYLGENFQVGHSYFMLDDIHQEETLRRVWRRAILPLLEEYFHNSRDREKLISEFSLDNVMHELDLSSPPIEEV